MTSAGGAAAVRVRVPAKINLHLAVGDRRNDGYHPLVTVFCAVSLYDEVNVRPAADLTVRTTGSEAFLVPVDSDNLAGAAVQLLAEHTGRSPAVSVEIEKTIPVAGGMAGGSADAAATLLGCAALWHLELSRNELAELGARLGSDVPFPLTGGIAVGTGRGEQIVPVLGRHQLHWVLALADTGLSTRDVFAELDRLRASSEMSRLGTADELLSYLTRTDAAGVGARLGNDLQPAAISLRPELRRVLRAGEAEGALAAVVSGSGPTVAMLCRNADAAADLAARLAGVGVCRSVRVVHGPVGGAQLLNGPVGGAPPHQARARRTP